MQADGVPQQLLKLKNGLKELRHLATLDPADPHRSALVRKLTEEGILARAYANPVYMLEFACASLRGNLLCDGKYSLDPNANQLNDAHILY